MKLYDKGVERVNNEFNIDKIIKHIRDLRIHYKKSRTEKE